jgi:hypothetical protein
MRYSLPLSSLWLLACLYSNQNREGLDLTCADLAGSNACRDGIITSCVSGNVQFRVCDDEAACTESWQVEGQFRCNQDETLPPLVLTGAGGSQGGTPSTGGAGAGQGGATGGVSSIAGMGGSSGATASECSQAPCVLAAGSGTLSALVADESKLFFAGCQKVWSIPKAGGLVSELASFGADGCGASIRLAVNSTDLFASNGIEVRRLAKDGSSEEVVDALTQGGGYVAADAAAVFWGDGGRLRRQLEGGMPETVADIYPGQIQLSDGLLYGTRPSGLWRIPTSGGSAQGFDLSGEPTDFAIVGSNVIVLLPDGLISRSLANASATTLAEFTDGWALAATDSDVYWTTRGVVHSVSLAGGTAVELASQTETANTRGSIVSDPGAVYWLGGASVYKIDLAR